MIWALVATFWGLVIWDIARRYLATKDKDKLLVQGKVNQLSVRLENLENAQASLDPQLTAKRMVCLEKSQESLEKAIDSVNSKVTRQTTYSSITGVKRASSR